MVLRAVRWGTRGVLTPREEKQEGADIAKMSAPSCLHAPRGAAELRGRGLLGELALLTRSGVAMNEPLTRRPVEQGDGIELLYGVTTVLGLLDGGTQCRRLGGLLQSTGRELPQFFFWDLDIRHGKTTNGGG